jgi:hypothetical protein
MRPTRKGKEKGKEEKGKGKTAMWELAECGSRN